MKVCPWDIRGIQFGKHLGVNHDTSYNLVVLFPWDEDIHRWVISGRPEGSSFWHHLMTHDVWYVGTYMEESSVNGDKYLNDRVSQISNH